MEAVHAASTAHAAKSELGALEDELVRDLFLIYLQNEECTLQDTLKFEVLKRVLKFEQIKQTTQAFQKSNTNVASTKSQCGSQIKIKQEPILAVANKRQAGKRYNRDQFRKKATREESEGQTQHRKETMQ